MRRLWVLLFVAAAVPVAVLACGTDPVGVESCRQIEQVRCESAPACGLDLGHPVHNGDSPEAAVASCIRYYHDACLHDLVTNKDPGSVKTQACVDAIIKGDCDTVKSPEKAPDCAFLVPPAAPAPAPAPAADAATE